MRRNRLEDERDDDQRFSPGVKNALTQLADDIDAMPDRPEAYAPPERRIAAIRKRERDEDNLNLVGHRAAGYSMDLDEIAREIAIDPKQDIKERFRRLTYGDMVTVCDGILAATENRPISNQDELAKVIHRWASS